MPSLRRNWFQGWRLFAVLTLVLIALSIWIAGMRQFEADGVRMVIRFTARTSLLFFCLAFSAAALARLWPNAWTRWQRSNRRYLGVTFAASHAIHAVAIVCFAAMDPAGYAAATSAASYIFGGIGYAFIFAMAATSFDRTTAAIGPRAWRILHLTGGYYLWFHDRGLPTRGRAPRSCCACIRRHRSGRWCPRSAYSAKVATGFAIRIRADII